MLPTPQLRPRNAPLLTPVPMDCLDLPADTPATDWLWHGLVARRNITLFTSLWKAGKTTLLTGLLQQFAAGGTFLDRPVSPAKVLVLSEESRETWAARLQLLTVGGHARLLPRPFLRRPTVGEWNELVDRAAEDHAQGKLDLLVIDPLARFLPGRTESDLGALLAMLDPLQRLCEAGPGVLMLHHPRKKKSEEGSAARGSGGLLAAVDIILELSGYGAMHADERRRKLYAVSRYTETPRRLVYEWDPTTGRFAVLGDPLAVRFHENWNLIHAILKGREQASTHHEILMDWQADQEKPSPTTLYQWLNRAYAEKKLRREGNGTRDHPYRYRLENADDQYWDRGELPPPPMDLPLVFRRGK